VYESLQRFDDAHSTYEKGLAVIERLLTRARAAIDAEGDAITAARYSELRSKIEKLGYERATILENLHALPEPSSP
ncbi:hypothetical protein KAT84_00270, partial [Candidatus Bipolaricaulota bacterium]|nr:hypothetical protein [Candidatus Bipolaricaulota bacterium]